MMTTITLARQTIRLYPRNQYTTRHAVNTLRRGWIKQIQYLGDKWLLAKSIQRKEDYVKQVTAR
jgi:hypothetical protein